MIFDVCLFFVGTGLAFTLWYTRKRDTPQPFERPFSNPERFAYWDRRIERELGKLSEEYTKLCADGKDGKTWMLDRFASIHAAKTNPNKFVWEQSQILIVYKRPVLRLAR